MFGLNQKLKNKETSPEEEAMKLEIADQKIKVLEQHAQAFQDLKDSVSNNKSLSATAKAKSLARYDDILKKFSDHKEVAFTKKSEIMASMASAKSTKAESVKK